MHRGDSMSLTSPSLNILLRWRGEEGREWKLEYQEQFRAAGFVFLVYRVGQGAKYFR